MDVILLRSLAAQTCLLFMLIAFGVASALDASDAEQDQKFEKLSRQSTFVVVGRPSHLRTVPQPNGGKATVGRILVREHVKGFSNLKVIEVEFPPDAKTAPRRDRPEEVWFIGEKLPSGRYRVVGPPSYVDLLHVVQAAVYRSDKQTRLLGMPDPAPGPGPLSLVLAAVHGQGQATTFATGSSLREIKLFAQFENHGARAHAVMPCLDGSEIAVRQPHYFVELVDMDGKPPRFDPRGWCGWTAPFRKVDFVPLLPGEVFRTRAFWPQPTLPAGKYKARLIYSAKQELRNKDYSPGHEPGCEELIKRVWEGTLVSNWIEVELTGSESAAEHAEIFDDSRGRRVR